MSKQLNGSSAIDLFCGCGGMTLGFQNAGFKINAGFDNWEAATRVYKENFSDHDVYCEDLEWDHLDWNKMKKYRPELVIGGPPCQDFSSAGKRNENLGRADLTIDFANIVAELKPNYFVMENVERISKSKALVKACRVLSRAGYGLTAKVLDASLCGVPQVRKRFFLIGEYGGLYGFLNHYLEANLSSKPMTIREYFGNHLEIDHYYRHPRSYERRGIFSVDEPSPTVRGVNRPIPPDYKGHPGDSARLTPKIRPLTTIERSYIQTFPFTFKFSGSKSEMEQMIGNAVPVKLAEYVASALKSYIIDKSNGRVKEKRAGYVSRKRKVKNNVPSKVKV